MARVIGCDFSSRPGRTKPIVIASGFVAGSCVRLGGLQLLDTLDAFGRWLALPGDWVGGFDFPFGLPRALVQELDWPSTWEACIRHYAGLSRGEVRSRFAGFCNARPAGAKFAHRATDGPAGSSPSMKWVNPPVAYMLHAGVPLLIDSGVHLPGLHQGSRGNFDANGRARRVALEAYPGMLAREVLGATSYKSDDKGRQTPQRLARRANVLDALESGNTSLELRLLLRGDQRELLENDASGDSLDAVLCMLQAAWGSQRGWPWFGLPECLDPLEGWIVSAMVAPP